MGILSALFVANIPSALGMIAANTYGQLTDSTLLEIFQTWKKYFGWTEYTVNNPNGVFVLDRNPPAHFQPHQYTFKSNNNKIYFQNGAVVQTASLENYKALDGRTIAWALLDETKDTKENAVKDVIISRLRQMKLFRADPEATGNNFAFVGEESPHKEEQVNPLFIFTAPAKEQWLTEFFTLEKYREQILTRIFNPDEYFHIEDGNKCIVVASTYHNQANLPPDYIPNLISDLSSDQAEMQVFGSPFGKAGGEYYTEFKKSIHVKPAPYVHGLPIHLAIDFNVHPYMTGIVWQIVPHNHPENKTGRTQVRAIDELCLANPRNTVEDLAQTFDGRYREKAKFGFYFYGDATGKNKLPLKQAKDYYNVLAKYLRHISNQSSRRLLKQNPRHRMYHENTWGRRDFMNQCFRGKFNFDIAIDPNCKNLIADYEFIQESPNGTKVKTIAEINGVRCEKYGHTSDASDAFFAYLWGNYAREAL